MLLDFLDDAEDARWRLASLGAARYRRSQDPPLGVIDGDPLGAERNDSHGRLAGAARLNRLGRAFAPAAPGTCIVSRSDQPGQSRNGKKGEPRPPWLALRVYATRRHTRPTDRSGQRRLRRKYICERNANRPDLPTWNRAQRYFAAWPPFPPPTTTPAAFSIGLIAAVKSELRAHVADHDFPQAPDRFGDFHRQPQRFRLFKREPHVLHHQAGRETEIEAARQHRARKLVAARGIEPRAGVDDVDHDGRIESRFDAHHHRFRRRDHGGCGQEIVGKLHGLRRAGFFADEEHFADHVERGLHRLEIGARAGDHHRERSLLGAADAAADGAVELHDVLFRQQAVNSAPPSASRPWRDRRSA